jgi:hypothetical protein
MQLQLTVCPQCAAPAESTDEGCVDSTDGPVRMARVRCVRRHWFLLPAGDLAGSRAHLPGPAASGVPGSPASWGLPRGERAAASGIVHEARDR